MGDEGGFNTREILGIATAGAIALGGIVIALTRSNDNGSKTAQLAEVLEDLNALVSQAAVEKAQSTQELPGRLMAAYPGLRDDISDLVARATDEFGARTGQMGAALIERVPTAVIAGIAEQAGMLQERAEEYLEATGTKGDPSTFLGVELLVEPEPTPANRVRDSVTSVAVIATVAAAIYALLASTERREAVKDAICRLMETVQTLLDDFRGTEEPY